MLFTRFLKTLQIYTSHVSWSEKMPQSCKAYLNIYESILSSCVMFTRHHIIFKRHQFICAKYPKFLLCSTRTSFGCRKLPAKTLYIFHFQQQNGSKVKKWRKFCQSRIRKWSSFLYYIWCVINISEFDAQWFSRFDALYSYLALVLGFPIKSEAPLHSLYGYSLYYYVSRGSFSFQFVHTRPITIRILKYWTCCFLLLKEREQNSIDYPVLLYHSPLFLFCELMFRTIYSGLSPRPFYSR